MPCAKLEGQAMLRRRRVRGKLAQGTALVHRKLQRSFVVAPASVGQHCSTGHPWQHWRTGYPQYAVPLLAQCSVRCQMRTV